MQSVLHKVLQLLHARMTNTTARNLSLVVMIPSSWLLSSSSLLRKQGMIPHENEAWRRDACKNIGSQKFVRIQEKIDLVVKTSIFILKDANFAKMLLKQWRS